MDAQQAAELRKPFAPNVIGKLPKGGAELDYVGHAATTDRLLAVDPSWTWEPLALDEHGLPALDGKRNLWIRLTVCGVTRIGVGDGMSAKECIGDAIRNAAMRFGVALDLWSKDELEQTSTGADRLRANLAGEGLAAALAAPAPVTAEPLPAGMQGYVEPGGITPEQLKRLQILLRECGVTDRDDALGYYKRVTGRPVVSSKALTWSEASSVIADLDRARTGQANVLDPATANDPANEGQS